MRIWKRAAWRKKLLKSSSEFSAIQEDSLLRLGILFLSCLCDCGAGVSLLRERQGGFAVAPLTPSPAPSDATDWLCLFSYLGKPKAHKL